MKIEWKSCFRIGVSAFLLFLCIHYCDPALALVLRILGAAAPVFVGLIMAYILNILMSFYEKHYFVKLSHKRAVQKTRRSVCMVLAILTLFGIVALIIRLVIPELVSCVKFLLAEIPPAIEDLLASEFVAEVLPATILSELSEIDWNGIISKAVQFITAGIGSTMNTIYTAVSSVISTIVTMFISFVFSIYLLLGKDVLQRQCQRLMRNYLRPKWMEKIMYLLKVFDDSFHRYIVGQCTEAVILGLLCMVGMFICRLPYAAMIGTLVGFTALIPVAGAYIGAIVGVIMILTVSPIKAVGFLVFIVVIQQLEGNLIYPRVVGKSIGLPGIWVLATVTIGSTLMGSTGKLIGVPISAAHYHLLRDDMGRRERALEAAEAEVESETEVESEAQ